MFNEYDAMKQANVSPDCYTMSILINAVLKGISIKYLYFGNCEKSNNINKTKIAADFDRFDELLNEIMDNKLIDVYIFSGLLDGLIKSGMLIKWNQFGIESFQNVILNQILFVIHLLLWLDINVINQCWLIH